MSLRITGGSVRGRVLRGELPRGVRPTGARVREALFSVLGQDLVGQHFLDAFAGSGIMALEAWSRGAQVTAVERDGRTMRAIRARAEQVEAELLYRTGDVLRLASRLGEFDVVYADPPFALDPGPILEALSACAPRLFLEARSSTDAPGQAGDLCLFRTREFGSVNVHEYRRR